MTQHETYEEGICYYINHYLLVIHSRSINSIIYSFEKPDFEIHNLEIYLYLSLALVSIYGNDRLDLPFDFPNFMPLNFHYFKKEK